MENSILKELQFDPEKGSLSYKGVRYLLIRPETLIGVQRAAEEGGGAAVQMAATAFFAGGQTGGALSTRRYREQFGLSGREVLEFMCRMGTEIGWGRFAVQAYDETGRSLAVEVCDSPFSQAYGKSDRPVCHLIRGVLAGVGEGLFGSRVQAVEETCMARGDESCRFVVKGKERP